MTCHELEQYLEQCVEQRIAPEENRVLPHVETCSDCRDAWESFLVLQTAVGHLTELEQVPDLTERVVEHWRQSRPAAASRGGSSAARIARIALGVVAAGVLLAIILPGVLGLFQGDALVTDGTSNDDGTQPVVLDNVRPPDPEPPVRLETILADTNGAIKTVWGQTGGAFTQINSWVPQREVPEPDVPEDEEEGSLTTHLQRDLQPLGRQFRDSIGFLLRSPASP